MSIVATLPPTMVSCNNKSEELKIETSPQHVIYCVNTSSCGLPWTKRTDHWLFNHFKNDCNPQQWALADTKNCFTTIPTVSDFSEGYFSWLYKLQWEVSI